MGAFRKDRISYLYSFLLHAGMVMIAFFFATRRENLPFPSLPKKSVTIIEVDPLPKKTESSKTREQVVQTNRGTDAKQAAQDAFLGERTQVVEEQKMSMPKQGTAAQDSQGKKADAKVAEAAAPAAPKKPPTLVQATGALAKFGIAISATKEESPKPKRQDLVEEASLTAQAKGEYVKGFKEGETTMLNTREFVFYGYFQRIRERLDRAWEQSLRDRLAKYFRRGRQLASEQDYTTQIMVCLDPSGKITKVQVISASGTQDLDEAAIKAFNDAGPFPNPPKGLVDASGQVLVRWDFVLKT